MLQNAGDIIVADIVGDYVADIVANIVADIADESCCRYGGGY